MPPLISSLARTSIRGEGYSYNGALGSVRDYYEENSDGQFLPVFDVYGPVTLSSNMATYGGNDSNGDDKAPEGVEQIMVN